MNEQADNPKELFSAGISVVEITDQNAVEYHDVLVNLDEGCESDEMIAAVRSELKRLWIFGLAGQDLHNPDNVLGLVDTYNPEHGQQIRSWVQALEGGSFDETAPLDEMASFVWERDEEGHLGIETEAVSKSLKFVFQQDPNKMVAIWIGHEKGNQLSTSEANELLGLGFRQLGTLRYDDSEDVDSTCFVVNAISFSPAV